MGEQAHEHEREQMREQEGECDLEGVQEREAQSSLPDALTPCVSMGPDPDRPPLENHPPYLYFES